MSAYKTTLEDFNIFTKATGQIKSTDNKRYSASIAHEVATGMAWQPSQRLLPMAWTTSGYTHGLTH